jgi:hypothetical protein
MQITKGDYRCDLARCHLRGQTIGVPVVRVRIERMMNDIEAKGSQLLMKLGPAMLIAGVIALAYETLWDIRSSTASVGVRRDMSMVSDLLMCAPMPDQEKHI